jgi:hypothetical protein
VNGTGRAFLEFGDGVVALRRSPLLYIDIILLHLHLRAFIWTSIPPVMAREKHKGTIAGRHEELEVIEM